ncbi:MAG: transposase, partial [Candidatus Marinimicrobia bacterium]|nr:transposase [Candidatus Neomarinimicrobiota bacterium]MCF7923178.1 transposase [Candidatus Neomarinimicrobiota bacterium]
KSLGRLIGAFKTVSTKQINLLQKTPGRKIWQRDFHDQIIRGDEDLDRIRRYIKNNPEKWGEDVE